MSKNQKRIKCAKRVAIGSFILATGIASWLNLIITDFFAEIDASYLFLVKTTSQLVLTIWILAGLWILVYGLMKECPVETE